MKEAAPPELSTAMTTLKMRSYGGNAPGTASSQPLMILKLEYRAEWRLSWCLSCSISKSNPPTSEGAVLSVGFSAGLQLRVFGHQRLLQGLQTRLHVQVLFSQTAVGCQRHLSL